MIASSENSLAYMLTVHQHYFEPDTHDNANAGPVEGHDVLQSMIKHGKSFAYWMGEEAAGEEGSLEAASSQLQYPLTLP